MEMRKIFLGAGVFLMLIVGIELGLALDINFAPNSAPAGNQSSNSIFVNTSAYSLSNPITSFINFDNKLVSWWRMDDAEDKWVENLDDFHFDNSTAWVYPGCTGVFGSRVWCGEYASVSEAAPFNIQVGKVYNISLEIPSLYGIVQVSLGGNQSSYIMAPGNKSFLLTAVNNNSFVVSSFTYSSFVLDIASVSTIRTNQKVYDYFGRNNGTAYGNATQTDSGKFGKGFEFDGYRDYINLSKSDSYDLVDGEDYTFSFWIYPKELDQNYQGLISKNDGGLTNDTGWYLAIENATDKLIFVANNGSSGPAEIERSSFKLSKNVWQHVAVVVKRSNDKIILYKNGSNKEEYSTSSVGAGSWDKSSADLLIGALTSSYWSFNGTIDDVLFFNRELSSEEISGLHSDQTSKYISRNFTGLSDGLHTVNAYVQDTYGNINASEFREIRIN
jgi:hypothetical protein